jgi:aspartyl-tRNA(Asn)/glutamyl-tRNA(Gln) amidotransferase subunit B
MSRLQSLIQGLSDQLPWLPDTWLSLLVQDPSYSLSSDDAKILVSLDEGARLIYYLDVISTLRATGISMSLDSSGKKAGKVAGNW